jgi:large subunit ribosomal protein L32
MANPKKRHTRHRRDKRRAQWKRLDLPGLSKCAQCGTQHLPHRICPGCGFYNGQLVEAIKERKGKGPEGQP